MQEENKSKLLIGTLVAVITLVIAVVGATYAFFSLNVSGDTTNTNVDIETGTADVVTIEQGAENIHINLAVSDMTEDNPNKEYYATDTEDNYKLSEEDGTLTFATITGTNKEASDCTAKVTITMDTSNDSMGKVLQKGDAILYITSGKTEETVDLYDLLTEELPNSVTKEIEVELSVSESAEVSITGYLKINNTGSDQSYLAGKTLNITITVNNLVCGNAPKPAIEQILANSTSGTLETAEELQTRNTELTAAGVATAKLDTLRRFVGLTTEVIDNYICFGTDNLKTCKENLDQYMYRIIGIDETNNLVKVIKATKIVKETTYEFQWHNSSKLGSVVGFFNSNMARWLNHYNLVGDVGYFMGNSYYSYMGNSNTMDIGWARFIPRSQTWYYGDSDYVSSNPISSTFVDERKEVCKNCNPIGLMYASDYLYAGPSKYPDSLNNWLFIVNGLNKNMNTGSPAVGDLQQPKAEHEWTMILGGGHYDAVESKMEASAIVIGPDGRVSDTVALNEPHATRPVFYLDASKIMLNGRGTIETPYYITNVS